jgi:ADP-heptose:LPS heptosyltransferase
MDPNLFTSKKNFCAIRILDGLFKALVYLANKLGLNPNREGQKNRLLLIGQTHLGDVLLATPAIRFAKQANPSLEMICIASSSSKGVLADNPYITGIEIIDLPWFDERHAGFIRSVQIFFSWVRLIKKVNAEVGINFSSTSYHREHLAMWLAGIPNRVGFSHRGFNCLLTKEIPFMQGELIARQKLRMMKTWLGIESGSDSLMPDIHIHPSEEEKAAQIFKNLGFFPEKPIIGINPGAQHSYLWPEEHFIQLCRMFFEQWQANLIFFGTKTAEAMVERIRANLGFKTFSVAGLTSLKEFAALLRKIDLLITIDTGARHIANAVGIKSIVLRNGANSVQEIGRYLTTEEVLYYPVPCSPCGKRICPLGTLDCMVHITPDMVMKTAIKVLGKEYGKQ